MYKHLRKRDGNKSRKWSVEELKDGFSYYLELHKRYPTALDIDSFECLPTSRSLQRNYGGLVQLRKSLGLRTKHFGKGKERSKRSGLIINRSFGLEERFYQFLTRYVKPVYVHEQKPIRPQNLRADYFVYLNPDNNDIYKQGFIIDIFFADNKHNLRTIINIKLKKYLPLQYSAHFVVKPRDRSISQSFIEQMHFNTIFNKNIQIFEIGYYKKHFMDIINRQADGNHPPTLNKQ